MPLETIDKPTVVLLMGLEPVRTGLLNEGAGVSFEASQPHVGRGRDGMVDVSVIGKADVLRNKRCTGRTRDLGDVEELS